MNPILKAHCETGHFSHGYLLIGDREKSLISSRKAAAILLNYNESALDSHPDFLEQFFDIFELEQSNELKRKFSMKPILAERKVFLLGINSFDYEAVNGLSKIIEDPPEDCYFFFMTVFPEDVPIVLRSRLVNLFEEGSFKLSEERRDFYKNFLKKDSVERLALAKNAAADKKSALEFLNELEIILSEKIKKERSHDVFKSLLYSLEELQANRRFLFDRASLPRMIIEHFALILPQLR